MAIMQLFLDLIWAHSRGQYLAAMPHQVEAKP